MTVESTPFESIAALKAEHGRLLRLGSSNAQAAREQSDLTSAIVGFLARVRATGACLDTPADREAAQSILDYWTAKLFTLPNGVSAASNLPTLIPGVAAGAVNLQLAEFDSKTVQHTAQAAENAFAALPDDEQALAQRMLMRLQRLPPGSHTFVTNKVTREELLAMGPVDKTSKVLNALESARVIREIDGQVQLQYDALARAWPRYADWLEKRKAFREAVQYWVQHKGESGEKAALLSGELLREVEKYHDLTGDEEAFKDASRGQEVDRAKSDRRWKWVFASVAAIALAGWAIAGGQAKISEERRIQVDKANLALVKKQSLTALTPMARAVTEIGLRPDKQGRQIARERLRQMMDAYQGNADLDSILQKIGGLRTIAEGKETTSAERRKVQYSFLVQGRQLRAQVLQGAPNEVTDLLKAERKAAFGMAEYCSNEIVNIYAKQPYKQADAFVTEFWLLYWGDLAFLEGHSVETAMVGFGRKLQDIDHKIHDNAPEALRNLTRTLDEKGLTTRQQNQYIQQSIDNTQNRIGPDLNRKVADGDVAELRRLLVDLKRALTEELGEPLEFNPPAAGY